MSKNTELKKVFSPYHTEGDVICVDMDGVIAEWSTGGAKETLVKGFFATRPVVKKAANLVRLLADDGYQVVILSSVYPDGTAAEEKLYWLDKNGLGDIKRVFVPYGENKSDYVTCTGVCLLIDDYSKNLHNWDESGRVGIKYMNRFNGNNGSWKKDKLDRSLSSKQMYKKVKKVLEREKLAG